MIFERVGIDEIVFNLKYKLPLTEWDDRPKAAIKPSHNNERYNDVKKEIRNVFWQFRS